MLDSYSGHITKITLQNFKGIGDTPVEIPLRPITLLFGKNSAGKSTIIQALLYTREVLRTGRVDVDWVELGGTTINLGGFNNFVHLHENGRAVKIRFDMDLKIDDQYDEGEDNTDIETQNIINIYIEFIIQYEEGHLYNTCQIGSVDAPYVSCKWKHNEKKVFYQLYKHQILDKYFDFEQPLPAFESDDSFPLPGHTIKFKFEDKHFTDPVEFDHLFPFIGPSINVKKVYKNKYGTLQDNEHFLKHVLNKYISLPLKVLKDHLEPLRYIGPIREIPPRDYGPRYTLDNDRWANGLAAWDILMNPILENSDDLLQKVNAALENLQLDYELHKRHFIALELNDDENIVGFRILAEKLSKMDEEKLKAFLQNEPKLKGDIQVFLKEKTKNIEVALSDIGVGISQVLPIVVGTLADDPHTNNRPSILAIEQPELHVHPAVQCELGDLFIRERNPERIFLIETHSEHLLLRILKRINQAYKKSSKNPDKLNDRSNLSGKDLAVIYIDNTNGTTTVENYPVDSDGNFKKPLPTDFFEERSKEWF